MDVLEKEVNLEIPGQVVDFMLEPYSPDCRYLRNAFIENTNGSLEEDSTKIAARGNFSIPKCFYAANGDGPSHFNATEFIICFNQLGYTFFADMIRRGLMPELKMNGVEEFKDAQLERCYIGKFYDIIFRRPIDSRDFSGRVFIEKKKVLRSNVFYSMKAEFNDDLGGSAQGRSLIIIVTENKS